MPGLSLISRVPKQTLKTITFTGLTGAGLVNETVAVATVTGSVLILHLSIECTTLLTENGATATISLGTTTTVAGLIAATDSVQIDANEYWHDPTPEANVGDAITNKTVNENIIIDCLVDDTATGVLEFSFFWLPASANGSLS